MKAAIALIFFACVAGSMAADARGEFMNQLTATGSQFITAALTSLQGSMSAFLTQILGGANQLIGTLGGRFDLLNDMLASLQGMVGQMVPQLLASLLGNLTSMIGSRGFMDDVTAMFSQFASSVSGAVMGMGQHLMNQGLSAVLGGLAGGRANMFSDMLASISTTFNTMIGQASTAVSGVVTGLQGAAAGILATAQPHWEDLQQQLLGHGMNVLGSVSETINNMHGSLVGGR
ncbi:unnamed protein product [Adineta steineri]|uniref:Uncharacterized protein n=1 Tax=Adineta steineri TaxID=433720 RepID=A0A819LY34_9BILA|nr:unnamed protein product [Adineta steineri]